MQRVNNIWHCHCSSWGCACGAGLTLGWELPHALGVAKKTQRQKTKRTVLCTATTGYKTPPRVYSPELDYTLRGSLSSQNKAFHNLAPPTMQPYFLIFQAPWSLFLARPNESHACSDLRIYFCYFVYFVHLMNSYLPFKIKLAFYEGFPDPWSQC